MDRDNFEFTIRNTVPLWHVQMIDGELIINDCGYDPHDEQNDPTYSLVREIAKLRGLIK